MAALPANMEHVDRQRLQDSLPSRIRYLHQFLGFGEGKLASVTVPDTKYALTAVQTML